MKKTKKIYWCDTCLGCNEQDEEGFKPRYYYCSQHVPIIKNKTDYIDDIIKKWENERR